MQTGGHGDGATGSRPRPADGQRRAAGLRRDGSDLRIMVYTAEPGTEDAERLASRTATSAISTSAPAV